MRASAKQKLLAAILAVVVLASAACGSALSAKTAPDSGKPSSVATPGASKPSSVRTQPDTAVDSLTAPLPAPIAMPAGSADQAAADLAGRMLKGGDQTVPALLAALRAAGFGVRGADGALFVKPAEPSQGLVFESWEVRVMAEAVQHKASIPLANLAEVLNSPLEELKGAPMDGFILRGVQTHAQDQPSPMRFWARFIVELGRQAQGHERYDLLSQVDPAKVALDPVQLSFVLRRMTGDMYAFSKSQKTSSRPSGQWNWWGATIAYADGLPCTLSESASSTMDVAALGTTTGFGELMGYLSEKGMAAAGKIGNALGYANLVGAYLKLIWVHAAFDLKIEMEDNRPLVRTKDLRPAGHGEQRTLAATVKMDIGNAQMLNCFRIMLNAAGLDFSLPNDGPVKGAHVQWVGLDGFSEAAALLHGGPEQIVRFVNSPASRIQTGGDPSSGENAVTNQSTNDDGEAFIDVEGVGQREQIGNDAKQVKKKASLRVNVQIQPANIFQDTVGAVGTGLGGLQGLLAMPADLMYRTRWAFGSGYTFEVIDWAQGGWRGTITAVMTTQRSTATANYSETFRETFQQEVTVTGPASMPGVPAGVGIPGLPTGAMQPGGDNLGVAMLNGTIIANYQKEFKSAKKDEYHGAFELAAKKYCTFGVSTQSSTAQQDAQGRASIIIMSMPGGQASIVVNSSDQLVGVEKHESATNHYDLNDNKGTCRMTTYTKSDEIPIEQGLGGIQITTTVDPKNPDVLKGSKTETSGGDTTTTITWDLSRN